MKINDVIINEMGSRGRVNYSVPGTGMAGTGASGFPTQPAPGPSADQAARPVTSDKAKGTAKFDPAVQARQQELIAAGAKIKADGFMGPKTREAEKQFGAQIDTAKAQAQQGKPGPTTVTNPAQADQNAQTPAADTTSTPNAMAPAPTQSSPEAPSADLDRLKQLAIGQPTLNQQASQQGAAMAQAAKPVTPAPDTNPLGVTAQAGGVFGQPGPEGDKPNTQTGQAAQPVKDPTVAPPVTSRSGEVIKTGTGGNLTSRSDDAIAWAAKNGGSFANQSLYPGPGNWDPKTGRTVKKDAQGNVIKDKGLGDRISDFFGSFGNKSSSGQAAQPASGDQTGGSTTGNKAFLPGAAGGAKEDIEILRKLSGL